MNPCIRGLVGQFWGRNRFGLSLLLLGLVLCGLFFRLSPPSKIPADIAKYVCFGCVLVFCYAISIFTYSNFVSGPAKESLRFPRRMFQLPVATSTLVLVPMLGGFVFSVLLWAGLRFCLLRPLGFDFPFALPALGMAVALGFFQALAWSPFGAPLVRALLATVLGSLVMLMVLKVSIEMDQVPVLPWLLGGCQLLALGAALVGVSHDRSGGSGGGSGILTTMLDRIMRLLPVRLGGFTGPARALLWFELRTKGLEYAILCCALSLFLAVVSTGFYPQDRGASALLFLPLLLLPLWSPVILGPSFGKPRLWAPQYGLSAFMACRPVGTRDLYASNLRVVLLCGLGLWSLVLALTALRGAVLGLPGLVSHTWEFWVEEHGTGVALLATVGWVVGLIGLSLGWLVSGLTMGLAGRMGVVVAGMLVKSLLIGGLIWKEGWIRSLVEGLDATSFGLEGFLAMLTLGRLLVAVGILRRSVSRGWIAGQAAAALVLGWGLALALLGSLLVWTWAPAPWSPWTLVLLASLPLPLVQPALGPMALAWNRHR